MNDEAIKWLREQVAQRMETAKRATVGPWFADEMSVRGAPDGTIAAPSIRNTLVVRHTWPQEAAHIIANDPQDVIARCEAELAILDRHRQDGESPDYYWGVWLAINHVATAYRHRPGYAEHWGEVTQQ